MRLDDFIKSPEDEVHEERKDENEDVAGKKEDEDDLEDKDKSKVTGTSLNDHIRDLKVPVFDDYIQHPVPCSYNYNVEFSAVWNDTFGGCTYPCIIFGNNLPLCASKCLVCSSGECMSSFDIFSKRHPNFAHDLKLKGDWFIDKTDGLCYCGVCTSWNDFCTNHPNAYKDFEAESYRLRQYYIYAGIQVRSGTREIKSRDGQYLMNAIKSSRCIGLSYTTDFMCHECRNILQIQAFESHLRRRLASPLPKLEDSVHNIVKTVQKSGVYVSNHHPGKDIILGTAELYREKKYTEDDFYSKIMVEVIEAARNNNRIPFTFTLCLNF